MLAEPERCFWVDLAGPSPDRVEAVARVLGLHPLIVEDVLEGNQRAKIETTDGLVHIVLFALDRDSSAIANEIDLVLAKGYLFTVHDVSWDPRASHHLRDGVEPILAAGPDHLLWAIGDDIVDGYFPYADRLGDAIDEVQDAVIRTANPETLERVFALKRELILVRRAASPTREVFNQLTNRELTLIDPDEILYFRSDNKYTVVATAEQDSLIRIPIRDLAEQLDPELFWQVHRGTLVNVNYIAGIARDFRGHLALRLKKRTETLAVADSYAHRFKQM